MRSLAFVLVTPLLACTGIVVSSEDPLPDGPPASDGGTTTMPPARGFQITSPSMEVAPGEDSTYCYYFRTSNTDELSIQRWTSHMGAGIHDIVLYLTPTPQKPPGTMNPTGCVIAKSGGGLAWSYAAQTTDAEVQLPGDDGEGNPIGQIVKAGQPGFLQIHVHNTTTATLHPDLALNAFAYPADAQVTPAAPFIALNLEINVRPGSTTSPTMGMVNGTCAIPPDPTGKPVRFFGVTTYTHKQGVSASVTDGAKTVVESTDWEHPRTAGWPPFATFASGSLSYQCTYSNPNAYTIVTGDDVTMQEMCMAVGYFFPAPGGTGHFCVDSSMLY